MNTKSVRRPARDMLIQLRYRMPRANPVTAEIKNATVRTRINAELYRVVQRRTEDGAQSAAELLRPEAQGRRHTEKNREDRQDVYSLAYRPVYPVSYMGIEGRAYHPVIVTAELEVRYGKGEYGVDLPRLPSPS